MSAGRMLGLVALTLLASAPVAAAGSLESAIAATPDGAWLEYEVALLPGDGSPCCFDWRGGKVERRGCALDGRNWNFGTSKDHLRDSDQLRVFLRKSGGTVDRVRAVGGDCPIDTGTLDVRRIDAKADESVAVLARLAEAGHKRGEPLAALAMHADRAATAALERLATRGESETRGDALFWLSQRGDADAERIILAALAPDVPTNVQKKAIFALSQLPAERSIPALTALVESNRPRAIRKEAMFWLAQHDSDEAFAVFD
ncbi:MAG TPA: HEAT repeat domain-containing protein, partial [Candidatus Saccharimonadia bacterium]|nr:HEAT repeat domain-containing protein [Candidatus Saccharimonadia bacterium]